MQIIFCPLFLLRHVFLIVFSMLSVKADFCLVSMINEIFVKQMRV